MSQTENGGKKRGLFRNTKQMCLLGLFVAIELLMKLLGLGNVPVGPLYMSFLTVPIAVGAMLLGPMAGLVMGAVFGLASLYDAITGSSVMTGIFFQSDPLNTIVLCVGMRVLMGWLTGVVFQLLHRRLNTVSYFLGALAAPVLNTLFFMGYIVLVFYRTEFVQNLVLTKGATNPLMFVVLLVGVQGLVEALVSTVIGGGVAKAVAAVIKKK